MVCCTSSDDNTQTNPSDISGLLYIVRVVDYVNQVCKQIRLIAGLLYRVFILNKPLSFLLSNGFMGSVKNEDLIHRQTTWSHWLTKWKRTNPKTTVKNQTTVVNTRKNLPQTSCILFKMANILYFFDIKASPVCSLSLSNAFVSTYVFITLTSNHCLSVSNSAVVSVSLRISINFNEIELSVIW